MRRRKVRVAARQQAGDHAVHDLPVADDHLRHLVREAPQVRDDRFNAPLHDVRLHSPPPLPAPSGGRIRSKYRFTYQR